MCLRKTPSKVAPMPRIARAGLLVQGVGLQLDTAAAERTERVAEHEQLGLRVDGRPLDHRVEPRPADLDPKVGRDRRQVARAPDHPARRPVDRHERDLGPGVARREGRLDELAHPGRRRPVAGHPRPDPRVASGRGQPVEVAEGHGLEPDDLALEDGRREPRCREPGHVPSLGNRFGSRSGAPNVPQPGGGQRPRPIHSVR